MQTTTSQAEIGLAEIDESIAHADHNIRKLGSLLPELASNGHPIDELEDKITLMTKALHNLRAQRRSIMDTIDGDEALPRIARTAASRARRRAVTLDTATVVAARGPSTWRGIYMRLRRS
jgi:cob(I)alamin adenosyltransferase